MRELVRVETRGGGLPVVVRRFDRSWTLAPQTPAEVLALAWLGEYSEGNTREAYSRDFTDYLAFCADHDRDPLAAGREVGASYARSLEARHLSRATVSRRLACVSSFYNYLFETGRLPSNPMKRVRRPKVSDESTTLGLGKDDVERFLQAAALAGPRDHALARLLLYNGLRVSEICAANVEDLGDERHHQVLAITRKGGKRHLIALAPATTRAIETHLAGRSTGPLLLATEGGRLDRRQAATIVARLARQIGVRNRISPHSLRHTWLTACLDAGVSLRRMQTAAGHVDPKTTIRYDLARENLDTDPTYVLSRYWNA